MLPSIGFSEMLLLAVLAIVFVGPKDMPVMMRTMGRWVAKIKAMGQEFKDAFDDMGAEGEMAELRKEIEELKSMGGLGDELDSAFNFDEEMRELDTDIRGGGIDGGIRGGTDAVHPRQKPVKAKGGDDGKT